jgi:hypothetical protein
LPSFSLRRAAATRSADRLRGNEPGDSPRAPGSESAQDALFARTISPLVWKIIVRQLGGAGCAYNQQDLEDVHAGVLLRLHERVLATESGDLEGLASLPDYAAVSAFNACSAFLMRLQPERTRLRYKVRYILRRDPHVAVWTGDAHTLLCGPREQEGSRVLAPPATVASSVAEAVLDLGRATAALRAVLRQVLAECGACEMEALVSALFEALELTESHQVPLEVADAPSSVPDAEQLQARLENQEVLAYLWREVLELPANQRIALLMNLRDESGGDMVAALLSSGVASSAELARCLRADEPDLGATIAALPRDDRWIAERLGLTRQQVINLRKSARLRLSRRLRAHAEGPGR